MIQGGFAPRSPAPSLYYDLLRSHAVGLYDDRGVKVRGLWYHARSWAASGAVPPARGGTRKRKWIVRERSPRPAASPSSSTRTPGSGTPCGGPGSRRTGRSRHSAIPASRELLKAAAAAGLAPRSDAELLPAPAGADRRAAFPCRHWPTQMAKKKRTEHAREVLQGQAAAADRPRSATAAGTVVAVRQPGWEQRAGEVAAAVDAERRRRRESAPAPPGARPAGRAAPQPVRHPADDGEPGGLSGRAVPAAVPPRAAGATGPRRKAGPGGA